MLRYTISKVKRKGRYLLSNVADKGKSIQWIPSGKGPGHFERFLSAIFICKKKCF